MNINIHHRKAKPTTATVSPSADTHATPATSTGTTGAKLARRKLRKPPVIERMPAITGTEPAAAVVTDPIQAVATSALVATATPAVASPAPAAPAAPTATAPSTPTPAGAASGSASATTPAAPTPTPTPSPATPSTGAGSGITLVGAPPDVDVPSVPDGFVPVNPADLKGYHPMQSELAVVPDAVTELQNFASYTQVFGMTAPDQNMLGQLLTIAWQWTSLLSSSTNWLTYVKSEEGLAWKDALVELEALKAPFQLAVTRTPTLMSQYPSLARLLGAQKVVAKRAASTRAKQKKLDAKAVPAPATTAASGTTGAPAASASTAASATTGTGPVVTVQA